MNDYRPRPFDTSSVEVPADLEDLLERLAENAHDLWAAQRMGDGWTYGPKRDDDAKEHPGLVPYGMLEESEKEYDRTMARGTIALILGLGWEIRRT